MQATLYARWRSLDDPFPDGDDHIADLSAQEADRAKHYLTVEERRRFTRRRAWLRKQLGEWLGRSPRDIRFTTNEFGKPAMADHSLAFSMSSSRGLALLVLGEVSDIGCDIEYCDPALSFAGIVQHCFSPAERQALDSLPEGLKRAAFYHTWTCKEAYTKAIGLGLSLPLDSFDVDVRPNDPARLLRGSEGLSAQAFRPKPEFQAAVVAFGAWRLNVLSDLSPS